ncbi:ankyrin repeat domain-containing protein [Aliarcobacter skirrowii]|uniref:ankyrin repeat domain-containing protein n=1 Tax=Aliarcobacter skirrowii TaxID=28200 RepID=UPI0029ADB393|nr:ankyrin repeat domain-containing protein [Aliarcobacter skirrowii]MDX4047928.1 ankyrin repeat domain-containing protein [Aliarcobacter skirrowii]
MLEFLSNFNRYSDEDFIKELLNPNINKENLDKIYKKSDINLNKLFVDDEPILIVCLKKNLLNSSLWLIQNGINTELKNSLDETAIFYAIYSDDKKIIESLLKKNANIDHLNKNKRTALQESIFNANSKITRFLLKKTISLKNSDINGNNVLFDAVNSGNLVLIEEILKLEKIDLNHKNKEQNSVIHLSNALENLDIGSLLIDYGADPIGQNSNGISYIFHLATKGEKSYKILKKIEEKGYNLNLKNSDGKNILMYAIEFLQTIKDNESIESQVNLIKRMFQLNIDKDSLNNESETFIFEIARSANIDLINFVFNNLEKQNLNKQNKKGLTPLFFLIFGAYENINQIDLFIENGANINYKNRYNLGVAEILINSILYFENNKNIDENIKKYLDKEYDYKTLLKIFIEKYDLSLDDLNSKDEPLFFSSILNFNFSLFKILRLSKIDFNKKDSQENTILHKLVMKNCSNNQKCMDTVEKIIINLIKIGINIDEQNSDGQTALSICMINKKDSLVKLLIENGASVNILDKSGKTLIHTAIFNDAEKYIDLIHKKDSEILNKIDNFGVTALNYCAFMGKIDLTLKLISLGAKIENDTPKSIKILEYLKKFHKNILAINFKITDTKEKVALSKLASNMIVEFNIDISKR